MIGKREIIKTGHRQCFKNGERFEVFVQLQKTVVAKTQVKSKNYHVKNLNLNKPEQTNRQKRKAPSKQ